MYKPHPAESVELNYNSFMENWGGARIFDLNLLLYASQKIKELICQCLLST